MSPTFPSQIAALHGHTNFITPARQAATPHVINCFDLNEENPYQLCALRERWDWCRERCPSDYEIEPLRKHGRLVGRRFRFARESDAALFKLFFC
jgi:hypothetical protein